MTSETLKAAAGATKKEPPSAQYIGTIQKALDQVRPSLLPKLWSDYESQKDQIRQDPGLKAVNGVLFRLLLLSPENQEAVLAQLQKKDGKVPKQAQAQQVAPCDHTTELSKPEEAQQALISSNQPRPVISSGSAVPGHKRKREDKKSQSSGIKYRPCVDDWQCSRCNWWNHKYHSWCRGTKKNSNNKCEAMRSWEGVVARVQEDGPGTQKRKAGTHAGDWFCGECCIWRYSYSDMCLKCCNSSADVIEYTMPNNIGLPERPPRQPPSPYRPTYQEERRRFWNTNGRFYTPRKKP